MADRAKAAAARTAAPVRRARGPKWWPSVYPFQLNQPAPADRHTACSGRPACRTPLAHECTVNPKRNPPLRSLPRLPRGGGARSAADRGSQQQVLSRLKSPGHSADGATERTALVWAAARRAPPATHKLGREQQSQSQRRHEQTGPFNRSHAAPTWSILHAGSTGRPRARRSPNGSTAKAGPPAGSGNPMPATALHGAAHHRAQHLC